MLKRFLTKANFLRQLWEYFSLWHRNLQAKFAKRMMTEEIIKTLELAHAQELVNYSGNEWVLAKRAQAAEIRAVRDGQIDIIDRRSWAFPYLPEALHRLNQPILKNTPYNIRRFSETPIPRRAINLLKNSLLSQFKWEVAPIESSDEIDPDREQRIQILTETLKRPNNTDSFRDLSDAVLEDYIIGGYGCIEPRMTPYYQRPFKLWAVDGSTIRIFMDWTESTPDRPRYAQMTGLKGERGIVTFLSDELIYIRDNIRSNTPFGLGKLEVGFNAVNAFLGVQEMASRAGSDQVHKNWLWWEPTVAAGQLQTVRRHILNEHEGQQKISLVSGLKKPENIDVKSVLPEDLLIDWQKFLLHVIGAAFDLSPMALGETEHSNRAIGMVMADQDFRSATLPMARRFEDAITRYLIHGFMKWTDLEFRFIGLEDPDPITRTMIQQRKYMMNAITPDEIREADGKPPLASGWGRLCQSQLQIMMIAAQAKLTGKAMGSGFSQGAGATGASMSPKGGTGGIGNSSGASGMGMGAGMGMGSGGMGMGSGSGMGLSFSAQDVVGMSPEEIQMYQELGILPPNDQIMNQLQDADQQQPGILQQMSEELKQFFDYEEVEEQEMQVQPAPITPADQKEQTQRWAETEHQESIAESVVNRRRAFGEPIVENVSKNATRGKYQKTPDGRFKDPMGKQSVSDIHKKHHKVGKNNPYR